MQQSGTGQYPRGGDEGIVIWLWYIIHLFPPIPLKCDLAMALVSLRVLQYRQVHIIYC